MGRRVLIWTCKVAKAVTKTHPERAIEIDLTAVKAQLPTRKARPTKLSRVISRCSAHLDEVIGRSSDWTALLTSIRETYRSPRFMELLDNLEGRTIRPQRK